MRYNFNVYKTNIEVSTCLNLLTVEIDDAKLGRKRRRNEEYRISDVITKEVRSLTLPSAGNGNTLPIFLNIFFFLFFFLNFRK